MMTTLLFRLVKTDGKLELKAENELDGGQKTPSLVYLWLLIVI